MARAFSLGPVKMVTNMPRMVAATTAAPAPWTNRAVTNSTWVSARPQKTEAVVNRPTPVRKTFLGPTRSPTRPASSRRPPKVMR